MNRRYSFCLALVGLVVSILACNVPDQTTPTSQAPPPSATSHVPSSSPTQETVPPTPTETPLEATTASAPSATTEATSTSAPSTATNTPPLPTSTSSPAATRTPTPPISTGPLDFIRPTQLDHWENLPDGRRECQIILQVTGGAPPYTVHHDLDVFTTWESKPTIVFTAHGCGAIVHTIKVESADGQTVSDSYWISPPWCGD